MSSEEDLAQSVKSRLEKSGVLDDLKCQIRTEVVKSLRQKVVASDGVTTNPDNFLINELIREYLMFNELKQTEQVLVQESGQPRLHLGRADLEKHLSVRTQGNNSEKVPLLYSIISSLTKK